MSGPVIAEFTPGEFKFKLYGIPYSGGITVDHEHSYTGYIVAPVRGVPTKFAVAGNLDKKEIVIGLGPSLELAPEIRAELLATLTVTFTGSSLNFSPGLNGTIVLDKFSATADLPAIAKAYLDFGNQLDDAANKLIEDKLLSHPGDEETDMGVVEKWLRFINPNYRSENLAPTDSFSIVAPLINTSNFTPSYQNSGVVYLNGPAFDGNQLVHVTPFSPGLFVIGGGAKVSLGDQSVVSAVGDDNEVRVGGGSRVYLAADGLSDIKFLASVGGESSSIIVVQSSSTASLSSGVRSFDGGPGAKASLNLRATLAPEIDHFQQGSVSIAGLPHPLTATNFSKFLFGAGGNSVSVDAGVDLSTVKVVDAGAGSNTISVGSGGRTIFYGGSYGHNVLTGPSSTSGIARLVGGPSAASLKDHNANPDLPSLGLPGGSNYKIDAGQGLAVMVGGAGTNEFDILGSQGAIIWGGGGTSTYKFTGAAGIAVVHMDNPTAEKVASLDFSIRSKLPESKLQWTVIINPTKDDKVFLDGQTDLNVEKDKDGGYFVLKNAPNQSLQFSQYSNFSSAGYGGAGVSGTYQTDWQKAKDHIDLAGFTDGDLGIHDTLPSFFGGASYSRAGFNATPSPTRGSWTGYNESEKKPTGGDVSGDLGSVPSILQSIFASYKAGWKSVHDTPKTINAGNQDGDSLTPNGSGDTLVAAGSDVNFALNATNSSTTIDNFGLSNNGTAGHIAFDASVSKTNLTVSTNTSGDILLTNAATGKTTTVTKALSDPDYAIAGVTFADGTTWSAQTLNDLSAAGTDNILWRGQYGETITWQVQADGSHTAVSTSVADPAHWKVVGYADGTGDGKNTVLWINKDDGFVYTWPLTNGVYAGDGKNVGQTKLATETLKVVGFSNSAGADKADAFLLSDTGGIFVWHLDPASKTPHQYVGYADPTYWSVDGFSERTDGHTDDVLWHGKGNELTLWAVQDGVAITQTLLGFKDMSYWSVAGFGADAGLPGRDEILWRGAGGETELSFITNGVLSPSIALEMRNPAMWDVESFTNTVRNGEAEIVWRNKSGDTDVMRLQGATITSDSLLTPNVDQYWRVSG